MHGSVNRTQQFIKQAAMISLMLMLFMLQACGGGGGSAGNGISRIELSSDTALLTELHESYQLKATAYDASGNIINADLIWASSNPAVISVDSSGRVTSEDYVGSSLITVQSGNVTSKPATVLAVQAMQNSVFVNDDEVIGLPELVDPSSPPQVGSLYTVVLSNQPPIAIGDMLLARESLPIGGRVVDVQPINGNTEVTLELVPVNELFNRLKIDQTYKVTAADGELPEALASTYALQKNSDGSVNVVSKSFAGTNQKQHVSMPSFAGTPGGTSSNPFHPLECSSTTPNIPLTLNTLPLSNSLRLDFDLIVQYDSDSGGLQKLAMAGNSRVDFKVNPRLDVAFNGKIKCELELIVVTVPVNGAASLVFGAQIPLGIGFEIGGRMTLAQVGADISSRGVFTAEIGVQKNGDEWEMINTMDTMVAEFKADYKYILPPAGNMDSQFRIEPSVKAYGFSKLAMGSRFARSLRLNTFKVTAGLVETAQLATVGGQVSDSAFKANYRQSISLNAGLAADAYNLFGLLNINPPSVVFTRELVLFTSPQLQTASADVSGFRAGDIVTFNVSLNPDSLEYFSLTSLQPYNIDDIIIYRRINNNGIISSVEVARATAVIHQAVFTLTWVADYDGSIGNDFYVFVDTKALSVPFNSSIGIPLLDELELGPVTSGSSVQVVSLGGKLIVNTDEGPREVFQTQQTIEPLVNAQLESVGFWDPSDGTVSEQAVGSLVWNLNYDSTSNAFGAFDLLFNGSADVDIIPANDNPGLSALATVVIEADLRLQVNQPVTIHLSGHGGGLNFVTHLDLQNWYTGVYLYRVHETELDVPIDYSALLQPGTYQLRLFQPGVIAELNTDVDQELTRSGNGSLELNLVFE